MKNFTKNFQEQPFSVKQHALRLCLLFVFLVIGGTQQSFAQPTVLGSSVANGTYSKYDLVTRGGGVRFVRVNATSAGTAGARNWEFATGTAASTSYTTNWRPYSATQLSAYNTYVDPGPTAGSARYNTGSGGASGTLPAVVSGSYYTFIVGGNSTSDNFMSVLSTTYNPVNITNCTQSPVAASVIAGAPVTVTVTTSATKNAAEYIYIRYSNDGFASSTIAAVTMSGTSGTAVIPASINTPSATLSYYIFSSNQSTAPSTTQADYFTLNLYNSSGQNFAGGGTNFSYTLPSAYPTYTWNQTATASWATATNWTPNRTTVGTMDLLVFNNGATTTATNIPASETIGGLTVSANTTVNLQMAAAGALTVNNGISGADLSVASGSALNANGSFALALTLPTGATGSISGNMTFTSSTHTLIATDASGITFNSPAVFTAGTGFTGGAFGGTGATSNSVIFASGSTYVSTAGANPFQKTQPASIVTFQSGSLFQMNQNSAPGFNGRTYANFEVIASTFNQTVTGAAGVTFDNITMTQGTLNLNLTAAINIKGNISVANGATLGFVPASATAINLNGTSAQTITTTGTGVLTVGSNGTLTVGATSTVNLAPSTVISGAGTFAVTAGGTLGIGSTVGIASSGATGNVQTTTRTFPAGANYVYNGVANQITGTGLPATVNTLAINNTGTTGNNTVTLSAITGITATTNSLILTAGNFDLNSKQLSIPAGGTVAGTGGNFTATAGPLYFVGAGTVSGTINLPSVVINLGVNFGTAATVLTSLQINSGGFINTNVPTYGSGSTLIYNSGTTYGRALEWSATSGPGYPYHVTLQGNTTLDLGNGGTGTARQMAGDLTVTNGSTLTLNNSGNVMTAALTVIGSVNNNSGGTITLSSSIGGDIKVQGDITDNGTFNFNSRAVFFQGSNTQSIQGSGTFDIPFVRINKTAGSVKMLANLTCVGVNGANAMEIQGTTSILDLNGFTLNLGAAGNSSTFNSGIVTSGYIKGSSTSTITILGSGSLGTIYFDPTTPGTTNVVNNLTLDRSSTGTFSLGNDLNVNGTLTLTNGTIVLGANNLTIGGSGSIAVTSPDATRMIVATSTGQLRKTFTTTGSFTYPIGDNTGTAEYSPATLNFTAGTFSSAYAGVNVTNSKHTNNASTTDYINRYWSVATSGITSPTCTASFVYLDADIAGTEANLYGGNYVGSTWNCLGAVTTSTNTISASISQFGAVTAGDIASVGCCINPTSGGTIATNQTICSGSSPAAFTSSVAASGQSGTLEYKWQSSTTSSSAGFSDIASSNAATYSSGTLTQTTWFKRLARVSCKSSWTGAAESNVIQVSVDATTVGGSVTGGTTVCNSSTSGLLTLAGNTGSVVRWESSVSPFTSWSTIATTSTTYTSGTLSATTQFRAVVQNGSCLTANSAATTVTVDATTVGGSVTGGTTVCNGSTSGLLTLAGNTGSVVRWESSVSPFTSWSTIATTSTTYTSGALSATTQFRAVVQNGSCLTANSAATTVTVDATTVGGSVTGGTTVCNGSTSGLLTLAGNTGSVVRWESTVSPFTSWTTIATTSTTYTSGTLSATTQFRAVVQNGTCLEAGSATTTVTVDATTVGGAVTGGTATCSGATSSLMTLSGHTGSVVRWESSVSPFASWSTIAHTSATYTSGTITETTRFRAVVKSGTCSEVASDYTTVTISSTTWDGTSWSNSAPTSGVSAFISGNYTSTASITACNLTVTSTGSVVISSGHNVTLDGVLTVESGGAFTLSNNANLFQNTTASNSGTVYVNRNSVPLYRQDYVLWSSPVSGQQLQAFTPLTNSNRFYTYNSNTNLFNAISSPSTTNFDAANGYLIRVPNNYPTATTTTFNGVFTGVANNGDYSLTLNDYGTGKRYNLIGNPYPSPISAMSFTSDSTNNTNTTGTLYFWRKTNNPSNPTYCTWTPAGGGNGTFVSNGQAQVVNPNGVIQTGQGFFVEGSGAGTTVNFKNSMRTVNNSDQFFRTATIESHRFWLNATNANGITSQAVIGYFSNATQGVDQQIDGKFINDGDVELASLIDTTPYTIQGRALPFVTSDVVPLHFKAVVAGSYSITIDHLDGMFEASQEIYLKDNLLNTAQAIKNSAYTFASEAGTFDSRFEIIYQAPLSTNTNLFNENSVIVYKNNGQIHINSGTAIMSSVKMFDLRGRLLFENNKVQATQSSIDATEFANQVVLIQITSENGTKISKKVMN